MNSSAIASWRCSATRRSSASLTPGLRAGFAHGHCVLVGSRSASMVGHGAGHLVEGEAEWLHPADDQDLLDVGLGVEAEPAVGAS